MYQSKYYTCEEIDERLLKGYYDDAVSKGYSDTFEQFKTELASIKGIAANKNNIETLSNRLSEEVTRSTEVDQISNSRILELEKSQWPLELTLILSSELLEYTGTDNPITVTYTVEHKGLLKMPNTLTLTKDRVDLKAEVTQSKSITVNVNKLGTTEFVLKANAHSYYDNDSDETSDIIENTTIKNLRMVLPIYAGFGNTATDVAVEANKLSVRTSAVGTYTKTATKDGVNFFILVPSTFSELTSFTMGGAPFVMETSIITTGEFNQNYKQYKSGATYNTGANVNIKAS